LRPAAHTLRGRNAAMFSRRHRLFLQRDFGQLNCNVVSRPLIIEISDEAQGNDKPANNQCCERFHQFSSSRFHVDHTAAIFRLMRAISDLHTTKAEMQ
jgi:hypothetical protein